MNIQVASQKQIIAPNGFITRLVLHEANYAENYVSAPVAPAPAPNRLLKPFTIWRQIMQKITFLPRISLGGATTTAAASRLISTIISFQMYFVIEISFFNRQEEIFLNQCV